MHTLCTLRWMWNSWASLRVVVCFVRVLVLVCFVVYVMKSLNSESTRVEMYLCASRSTASGVERSSMLVEIRITFYFAGSGQKHAHATCYNAAPINAVSFAVCYVRFVYTDLHFTYVSQY